MMLQLWQEARRIEEAELIAPDRHGQGAFSLIMLAATLLVKDGPTQKPDSMARYWPYS